MDTRELINGTLRVLGLTGFEGVTIAAPNATQGLKALLRRTKVRPGSYGKLLMELKRRELVHITTDGNNYSYTLTPAGVYRLQQVIINELEIPRSKKWDHKWRVVSFDVPVRLSKQRAAFTQHLQALGFVMLQKSMWLHPFPCFDEIEQLAGHYNVLRYCTLMEADRLDDQSTRRLLNRFNDILN